MIAAVQHGSRIADVLDHLLTNAGPSIRRACCMTRLWALYCSCQLGRQGAAAEREHTIVPSAAQGMSRECPLVHRHV